MELSSRRALELLTPGMVQLGHVYWYTQKAKKSNVLHLASLSLLACVHEKTICKLQNLYSQTDENTNLALYLRVIVTCK